MFAVNLYGNIVVFFPKFTCYFTVSVLSSYILSIANIFIYKESNFIKM